MESVEGSAIGPELATLDSVFGWIPM